MGQRQQSPLKLLPSWNLTKRLFQHWSFPPPSLHLLCVCNIHNVKLIMLIVNCLYSGSPPCQSKCLLGCEWVTLKAVILMFWCFSSSSEDSTFPLRCIISFTFSWINRFLLFLLFSLMYQVFSCLAQNQVHKGPSWINHNRTDEWRSVVTLFWGAGFASLKVFLVPHGLHSLGNLPYRCYKINAWLSFENILDISVKSCQLFCFSLGWNMKWIFQSVGLLFNDLSGCLTLKTRHQLALHHVVYPRYKNTHQRNNSHL